MAVRRRCEFCDSELPKGSRPNRKFCDDDCRRGRSKAPSLEEIAGSGSLVEATEQSIAEAKSQGQLGPLDAGAVAALRVLADKIDTERARWEYAFEWAQLNPGERGGPKPPANDNVSLPTYLRFLESLALTPAGRGRLDAGSPDDEGGGGGDRRPRRRRPEAGSQEVRRPGRPRSGRRPRLGRSSTGRRLPGSTPSHCAS